MATATLLTPNDLIDLAARDGKVYELSEGRVIEVGSAGYLHELIKSQLLIVLIGHVDAHPAGRVFSESMFPLAPHTARIPDVSYVRREKLLGAEVTKYAISFVPDLAIEIISDSETALDTETKLREYLAGGVSEVWQVYPNTKHVVISDGHERHTFEADEPLRSAVLPELAVRTSKLFTF